MAETRTLDGAILRLRRLASSGRLVLQMQLHGEEARQALLEPETRAWLREQLAALDPDEALQEAQQRVLLSRQGR